MGLVYWVLLGFSLRFISTHLLELGFTELFMDHNGFYWVFMGCMGFPLEFKGFGCFFFKDGDGLLSGFTEFFYWVSKNFEVLLFFSAVVFFVAAVTFFFLVFVVFGSFFFFASVGPRQKRGNTKKNPVIGRRR